MNYVLYGEEHYLLKEALEKIKKEAGCDQNAMNLITYHARQDKLRAVLDDAMTVPFFAEQKVIVVDHCDFLCAKATSDWNLEELLAYLRKPLASTVLVLLVHHDKLDTRKKGVKEIQKLCRCVSFAKLDDQRKSAVLRELIRQKKIRIAEPAFHVLELRLPADLQVIHQQLDKLALYGDFVDEKIAMAMVPKPLEEDVFAMVNAIIAGKMKQAFALYRDLEALHHDAIYLLAVLASQLRFLYQVAVLMRKGYRQAEIADYLHAHPYRVKLSMQSVQLLSPNQLWKLLAKCAQLDQNMKAGKIDKRLGFELLLLDIRRDQL